MTFPAIPEDLLFALFCLFFAGLSLLKASKLHHKRQHFLTHGLSATATVVRLEENPRSDPRTYFPILQFQTINQEIIVVGYPYSKRCYQFQVGELLQIRYYPSTPTEILGPSYNQSDILIYRWLGRAAGVLGVVAILFYLLTYSSFQVGVQ